MKKLISIFVVLLLVGGCAVTPEEVVEPLSLSILAPKGSPALALLPLVEANVDQIDFVDGSDLLSAEFVKGEYDVIVAPINLGAMLYSKGNETYKLYGVLTWGSLYIVGTQEQPAISPLNIALFGDKAVPSIIFNTVHGNSGVYNGTYFNAVSDVQAQLLTSQYSLGLLAEPLVSATLAKSKEVGLNLIVVEDLQASYAEKTGFDNYPQAALFVKADADEAVLNELAAQFEILQSFQASVDSDVNTLDTSIESLTRDDLGLPATAILKAAWERMNIEVYVASDVKESIEGFLGLIKLSGLDIYK